MSVTAVYPGTFDPFTNGHIDLVMRGRRIFPRLIVAVAGNPQKQPFFSIEERLAIIREAIGGLEGVEIDCFNALTVDYVRAKGAQIILRGVRAVSDFEFEFAMALMNRKISEDVETLFLMPNQNYSFLSSRLVKEVAMLGGNVSEFVPPLAERLLKERARQLPSRERRNP